MYPIYETESDRAHARQVMKIVAGMHDLVFKETERLAYCDFIVAHAEAPSAPIAIVEVKCRNCWFEDYKTYAVSEAKIKRLLSMAARYNLPTQLIVAWKDVIGGVWLQHATYTTRQGGRYDRPNDPTAIESMCHFTLDNFHLYEG